ILWGQSGTKVIRALSPKKSCRRFWKDNIAMDSNCRSRKWERCHEVASADLLIRQLDPEPGTFLTGKAFAFTHDSYPDARSFVYGRAGRGSGGSNLSG